MALKAKHNNIEFGVGDTIRVIQSLKEGGKTRSKAFEGMVIGIKGREENKTFTVRKIGVGKIGIERIFPLFSPLIEKIEVVRTGVRGVRRAKLYYTRTKPHREIEKIYSRAARLEEKKAPKKRKNAPKKKS
ncbi:50S ribosomal protein L19 [Candidatus Woesebacteria bacterium]|nr:50S ribosomal protein L19 [Candidatus Woesebacteria bacterium]